MSGIIVTDNRTTRRECPVREFRRARRCHCRTDNILIEQPPRKPAAELFFAAGQTGKPCAQCQRWGRCRACAPLHPTALRRQFPSFERLLWGERNQGKSPAPRVLIGAGRPSNRPHLKDSGPDHSLPHFATNRQPVGGSSGAAPFFNGRPHHQTVGALSSVSPTAVRPRYPSWDNMGRALCRHGRAAGQPQAASPTAFSGGGWGVNNNPDGAESLELDPRHGLIPSIGGRALAPQPPPAAAR